MKEIKQMLSEIRGVLCNAQGDNYFCSFQNIGLIEI